MVCVVEKVYLLILNLYAMEIILTNWQYFGKSALFFVS